MKILYLILGFTLIFSSVTYAECVKKQGIIDWILGEYTVECSGSHKVSNNDSNEDILVRAGLVAVAILIVWHIYEYGQQPKYVPSIRYHQLNQRFSFLARLPKSLTLESNLFMGRNVGFGFTLKF